MCAGQGWPGLRISAAVCCCPVHVQGMCEPMGHTAGVLVAFLGVQLLAAAAAAAADGGSKVAAVLLQVQGQSRTFYCSPSLWL